MYKYRTRLYMIQFCESEKQYKPKSQYSQVIYIIQKCLLGANSTPISIITNTHKSEGVISASNHYRVNNTPTNSNIYELERYLLQLIIYI